MTQPSPSYSILYSAAVSNTATAGSVGDVLITDFTTGQFVLSTPAIRAQNGGGRRSVGVALSTYTGGQSVDIQQLGRLSAAYSGLAAGAVSWVRVSATGRLERCTPGVGDDVMGKCEADGTVYLDPGKWDSTNYAGGGGGGTVPSGTGFTHITGGAQDAAARAIDLSTADTTGTLVLTRVAAPTGTGFATVTAGAWDAAAATYPIAFAKGGTGATSLAVGAVKSTGAVLASAGLGSGLQVLRTNAGATDVEWATPSSFSAPTGTGFMTVTGGVMDGASLAFPLSVAKGGTGAATFGTAGILHGSGTSAVTCSLIVDADVSASAAIASSKLAAPGSTTQVMWNNGGTPGADSGFTYSSGVANLSTALTLGSTVATAGDIRLRNTGAINQRNAANTQNLNVVNTDGSDVMSFGDYVNGTWTVLQAQTNLGLLIAGNYSFLWQNGSTAWKSGGPIHGYTGLSSPHGVHGWSGIVVTGSFSIAAADYAMPFHKLTGTPGAFTVTYPAPADDAHTYWQWVWNTTNVTATISTGAGATIALLTNKAQLMSFSTAGVIQIAAAV